MIEFEDATIEFSCGGSPWDCDSELAWLDGETLPASQELDLRAIDAAGPSRSSRAGGVAFDAADVDRYLGVVERRVRGQTATGACSVALRWIRLKAMKDEGTTGEQTERDR